MNPSFSVRVMAVLAAFVFLGAFPARLECSPRRDSEPGIKSRLAKKINQPNPKDAKRLAERRKAIEQVDCLRAAHKRVPEALAPQLTALTKQGTDRILVLLVEFTGSDTFTFTPGVSTWDPIGRCDSSEYTGNSEDLGTPAAANLIIQKYNITGPTDFTYSGPLHNQIERPLSASDRSGDAIWVPDFSPSYYRDIIFGNGVKFEYTRQDGSQVYVDHTGKSVRDYYYDLSAGRYNITGEVVGWLPIPHSMYYYGADPAPGARSGADVGHNGAIPGAGNSRQLVIDAFAALFLAYPDFNPADYDQDGDGILDRVWIIHAGYGEEDSTTLLNRTSYGEGALWSHSSQIYPPYTVYQNGGKTYKVGPYIMMPENSGIGVLAHEYGHNIGTDDLYAYSGGETSAGFWTIMADDWTGFPIGFLPPALDPWHLDNLGWLNPYVIVDPSTVHEVTLGQASYFPAGENIYRGIRISLPDKTVWDEVQPIGEWYWWGGRENESAGAMQLVQPIALPANAFVSLSFELAYDIEKSWDFLWIEISEDNGATWKQLTNAHTTSQHDPDWIGSAFGFPDDLAAAGIGGFSGQNADYPNYTRETFDLAAYAGKNILLKFWYMTDWSFAEAGPYIDNVLLQAIVGGQTTVLLADDAESDSGLWQYTSPLLRTRHHAQISSHNYYLQWRNTTSTGGYDSALGDPLWRFAPANTGLLVWYNDNTYADNEIASYLTDWPSFGPKGRMLVIEAHPEPYRDPTLVEWGFANEAANLSSRSQMRDATLV